MKILNQQKNRNVHGNEALATGTKTKQPKEVEIKVGLAYVNDGVFKARRNKTHILKVKNDIERDELIEKAITKHANFDQSFDRVTPMFYFTQILGKCTLFQELMKHSL